MPSKKGIICSPWSCWTGHRGMGLKHSEGGGHWVLGTQRTDIKDWLRLLGPGCVCSWWAPGGGEGGAGGGDMGVIVPGLGNGELVAPLRCYFMVQGACRWETISRDARELLGACTNTGGSMIRMMCAPVTHLEILSGLLIEGREDYWCYESKREHYHLFPWMIQVTRLLLVALVWVLAWLFRKKNPNKPVMKNHPALASVINSLFAPLNMCPIFPVTTCLLSVSSFS